MNKILAVVLLVAVAAQAKYIPELVDRIALYPEALKNLGLDAVVENSGRIVGGVEVSPKHSVPWQVALNIDGTGLCGGSIISENWILTAAHCADGASFITVIAGAHDRTDSTEPSQVRITSRQFTVHENWTSAILRNDVALIQLPTPLTFTAEISRTCLAPNDIVLKPGEQRLTITGWGKTGDGFGQGVSDTLRTVDLLHVDNSVCAAYYNDRVIVNSTLCASTEDGHSTCNGDSGGPLTEQQIPENAPVRQVGIVSFGSTAGCDQKLPVGFARVSSFVDWITEKSGVKSNCQ